MKKLYTRLYTSLSLMLMTMPLKAYATSVDGVGGGSGSSDIGLRPGDGGKFESGDKESFADQLKEIFTSDAFKIDKSTIESGQALATPIITLINTFTIALYLIVVYIFFGQTAIDLFYIFCPLARGMMERRAENKGFGEGRSAGNFCISESAYEAVHGSSSSGGFGNSGGERSHGTAILKYVGTRIGELAVFIFFSVLFLGGMIGQLVMMLFYLLAPVIQTLINLGQ